MTSGDSNFLDPGTLAAVIARSSIVIAAARPTVRHLPSGFDATDIAILEWIVAEGRRAGRLLARM